MPSASTIYQSRFISPERGENVLRSISAYPCTLYFRTAGGSGRSRVRFITNVPQHQTMRRCRFGTGPAVPLGDQPGQPVRTSSTAANLDKRPDHRPDLTGQERVAGDINRHHPTQPVGTRLDAHRPDSPHGPSTLELEPGNPLAQSGEAREV